MRIIQHGGSNLIITKHARPKMAIHRKHSDRRRETVTEKGGGEGAKLRREERVETEAEKERYKTAYRY